MKRKPRLIVRRASSSGALITNRVRAATRVGKLLFSSSQALGCWINGRSPDPVPRSNVNSTPYPPPRYQRGRRPQLNMDRATARPPPPRR